MFMYIYIYIYYISLSLSLYIYIYIYIYTRMTPRVPMSPSVRQTIPRDSHPCAPNPPLLPIQ